MQSESTRLLVIENNGEALLFTIQVAYSLKVKEKGERLIVTTISGENISFSFPSLEEATYVVRKLFATGYAIIEEDKLGVFRQEGYKFENKES